MRPPTILAARAWPLLFACCAVTAADRLLADEPAEAPAVVSAGGLPLRVHVFEDYETEIERRWWLRGAAEEEFLPDSLSASVENRRCCRAAETKDFDDLMGDSTRDYKAVIFNPVPGPP